MPQKRSKLREKPARMPAIQLERKAQTVREYVSRASQRTDLSEYARSVAFIQLLKDLLLEADPQSLHDYLAGMERSLGGPKSSLYTRGRPDALYGNLVIEFKRNLAKSLDDAKEQLARYLSILLSEPEDRDRPLIGIATDGVRFEVFAPRFDASAASLGPEDVSLVPSDSADLASLSGEEAYYWLDRWFTRQTGRLKPRTRLIVEDFGPTSGAYIHTMNLLDSLWKSVEMDSESQVFFENWQKYLRITYGGPVADRELFLRHTYLATLAKIMVWSRLTEGAEPPAEAELRKILNGQYFSERGIQNFLEEDFFAWLARDAAWTSGKTIARRLLLHLGTYNLRELSEDVLKGLYERLVDPKDRHDLGEFYTPDWLAAAMVRESLGKAPNASVLDPACGSGTFLYQTIRLKRERLGDSAKTLKHVCENVVGVDIHPLAVIVAKTTYLLALGALLEGRPKAVRIPVYLADSIKLPEERVKRPKIPTQHGIEFPSPPYVVLLGDGDSADFPEDLALSGELYDRAIELCSQYARSTRDDPLPSEADLSNFIQRNEPPLLSNDYWRRAIYELFKLLRKKIRERKDTIWAFILKNVFKPLLLRGKFDLVIGNPPWLTYNRIEKGEYQAFVKRQITQELGLLTGRPELLTHMELGTLFFVRCADLYLKDRGRIAFVLPKSIFVADQHHALRTGSHKGSLRMKHLWDLEGVRPLFNVPAAVALAEKVAEPVEWPLRGVKFSGELPTRNASLAEAEESLRQEETQFWLSLKGKRSYFSEKKEEPATQGSPYREKFAEGATIVPRSFWFVEVQKVAGLGSDPTRPYVKTDPRAIVMAKDKYKDVCLEGNVEAEFLYRTLLSTDLVPFGHLPFRTVVLPIRWRGDRYEMLNAAQARREGYLGLAEWLEKCETIWNQKQGEKAKKETIYTWLDYRKKLTQQRRKRYTILYPDINRVMFASLMEDGSDDGGGPHPAPFVDYTNLYADTEDAPEAYYLLAFLNAPSVDRLLQSFRRKEQGGHPHIMKKIWELPIPAFNSESDAHRKLSTLGMNCAESVRKFTEHIDCKVMGEGRGGLRRLLREQLEGQITEIDKLVRPTLNIG